MDEMSFKSQKTIIKAGVALALNAEMQGFPLPKLHNTQTLAPCIKFQSLNLDQIRKKVL